MSFEILNDFEFQSAVSEEVIKKYKDNIPNELLEIWNNYGFGTFADGYMKIINPDEYMELLEQSYFDSAVSIPIFVTGLADIIIWRKNKYVGIVRYRKSNVGTCALNFNRFMTNFQSSKGVVDFLDNEQYNNAVKLLGKPDYDECFGYVPLLALGGSERVEKLQKMKVAPHIDLIIQSTGRIE